MVDGIATSLIPLTTGCDFGLHSGCDANKKGNRRAKVRPKLSAAFSCGAGMRRAKLQ